MKKKNLFQDNEYLKRNNIKIKIGYNYFRNDANKIIDEYNSKIYEYY